jgi:hypothetical protein
MDEALVILEELHRRNEHIFHAYEPQPNQELFHKSDKYIRILTGGNQSGKSRAAAQEVAWWFTHSHPHRETPDRPVEIWVISTEYYTIKSGVYRHLMNLIPDWEILAKGPKVQGHDLHSFIKSKRGDLINFMSTKGGEDSRSKFQAAEVDLAAIDEEIEYYVWDELQARMLTTGGCFTITATLVESYDWIVELERLGELGDKDVFLGRLNTEENIYADQRQIQRLSERWDDDTKRVRFYGYSARARGLVYRGFGKHNILPTFDVPRSWPRWCILDPGYRTFAVLWGTVTPFGQKICYRELYLQLAELPDVVEEIKLLEKQENTGGKGEIIGMRIIDDKEGSRLITGQMGIMSQLAADYNFYCAPAMKAKHAGIEKVRQWLKNTGVEEKYEYASEGGEEKILVELNKGIQLFVFDTCENLIKEFSNYRIRQDKSKRDKNAAIDETVKKDDHLMDCIRYWAISEPEYYKVELPEEEEENSTDDFGIGTLQAAVYEFHNHRKDKVHEILGESW